MTLPSASPPVVFGRALRKTFRRGSGEVVHALDGVSLSADEGSLTALVGPDGAGKTTLLRLIAGLFTADSGELKVLGIDVAADPQSVQSRISYMPQRFGLYEDLTVEENLNLYADLHGVTKAERGVRYPQLMEMTALGPFTNRLAGRLSGGMKQKLGLACTLVREPDLLLLDEPTVGVDPLSRRELWQIILKLVHDERLTVLLSTSYLDEAERCDRVIVLHEGKVLAESPPGEVSQLAAGRTFIADPPQGSRRAFCKPNCSTTRRSSTPCRKRDACGWFGARPGGRAQRAPRRRSRSPGWRTGASLRSVRQAHRQASPGHPTG